MPLFLAVDCGGSKTAVAIADARGTILARASGGPSNITYLSTHAFIASVSAAISAALVALPPSSSSPTPTSTSTSTSTLPAPPTTPTPTLPAPPTAPPFHAAWFGISGADSPTAIAHIAPALAALLALPPARLAIANDTALLAAPLRLHPAATHAVAAIAGTGSIAVAFARSGGERGGGGDGAPVERARRGGWGWILGDEGSGFALGRAALRAVLAAGESGASPDVLAGPLVKGVLAHFGAPDVLAILPAVYAPDPLPGGGDSGSGDTARAGVLAALPREKRISALPPLVFAAAFEHADPLALAVVRASAGELAAQIAGLLDDGAVVAARSVLCFGGSLVGVDKYRALVLADLAARGHEFMHVAFVDDPAASGARGLAASFAAAADADAES